MIVGYLPRGTNRQYQGVLWRAIEMNWVIAFEVLIVGGWDRGRNDRAAKVATASGARPWRVD